MIKADHQFLATAVACIIVIDFLKAGVFLTYLGGESFSLIFLAIFFSSSCGPSGFEDYYEEVMLPAV